MASGSINAFFSLTVCLSVCLYICLPQPFNLKPCAPLHCFHRDLKPSNIFMQEDWSICIGDFGVATIMRDARTKTRITVGMLLTHWPLGNVAIIFKIMFSNSLYRILAWTLAVIFLSGECSRISLMRNQHWSTHWGRSKMATFSRRYFQMYFLQWKCINFDLRFLWSLFLKVKLALVQIMAWRQPCDKPLS